MGVSEIELGDGIHIAFEDEIDSQGEERLSSKSYEALKKSFPEALEAVEQAATLILKTSKEKLKPSVIEVELGIKLSAEFGAVIAKSTGEAHFSIKLQWNGADADGD